MKNKDQLPSSAYGFYEAQPGHICNNSNEIIYILYAHNVLRKMHLTGGILYAPFIYRGRKVLLKGDKLYPCQKTC